MIRRVRSFFFLMAVCFVQMAAAAGPLRESIATDYEATLESLFRHFHQNPELSNREFETARRLATELHALGYDVTEQIGGTGVVAVLRNGEGPTVMLRADMDGLPVVENSGLPYASMARQIDMNGKEQPVMHACGHDVHITALVGAARQMATRLEEWSGTLVLIGQPAEELGSGARAMLDDGLFERFPKPDYALAFHVSSLHPAGKIEVRSGITASSVDSVDIVVHGVGAHGAYPHRGVDPVLVASQIVVSLQSVVSRTINPLEPGVITVGAIHGGTKHNIIGDRVDMQLTVRADNFETRELLLDSIDRVADGVARSLGVPNDRLPEVKRSPKTTPPLINDEQTAQIIKSRFLEHFGEAVRRCTPRQRMWGEDFAYFVTPDNGVKGVYFVVGGTAETELDTAPSHHSSLFKIEPEPAVRSGVEARGSRCHGPDAQLMQISSANWPAIEA